MTRPRDGYRDKAFPDSLLEIATPASSHRYHPGHPPSLHLKHQLAPLGPFLKRILSNIAQEAARSVSEENDPVRAVTEAPDGQVEDPASTQIILASSPTSLALRSPRNSPQNPTERASPATSTPTYTSTYSFNIQSTQSHQDGQPDHTSEKTRMARSVVVPIAAIILTLFGVFAWHKYRTRRADVSNEVDKNRAAPLLMAQPYLQQKAELEDEERRTYELEASTRRGELEGNPVLHEMAGEDRIAQVLRETSTQRGFERVSTIPSSNG
ncbi:MAG: hypothetical protein Q9190_000220 [Brigantiaea leucoxantha]